MHRRFMILSAGLAACGALWAQPTEEVPFVTTPDRVTLAMLQAAGVGPRDHVIDLGSGDGRIVITAAAKFGASGLGVEIVPELVERSRANAQRAGVAARAEFRVQDLFQTDLSAASVITMYLLPDVNLQLRPRLQALAPGTRLVSHDWDMGDWRPDQTLTIDVPEKAIGREKLSRVHLWVVPAQVQGLWCSAEGRLLFDQRHQAVQAQLTWGTSAWALQGRMDGPTLHLMGAAGGALEARVDGAELTVKTTAGPQQVLRQARFRRASADRCPA